MPFGQMSVSQILLATCLLAKCLSAKCLLAQYLLAQCLLAQCLLNQCILAQCLLAKCLLAKILLAKCLQAKCLFSQCQSPKFLLAKLFFYRKTCNTSLAIDYERVVIFVKPTSSLQHSFNSAPKRFYGIDPRGSTVDVLVQKFIATPN